MHKQTKLK